MKANQHSLNQADPQTVLSKAVLSVVDRLQLTAKTLSQVIGCSEASVSRLKSGRGIDPQTKQGELALLLVRLYRSLNALLGGNDEQSREWLFAMNQHLGGVPVEKIKTTEGLVDVVQYLDAMRGRI